jgi:hypothetical protein
MLSHALLHRAYIATLRRLAHAVARGTEAEPVEIIVIAIGNLGARHA